MLYEFSEYESTHKLRSGHLSKLLPIFFHLGRNLYSEPFDLSSDRRVDRFLIEWISYSICTFFISIQPIYIRHCIFFINRLLRAGVPLQVRLACSFSTRCGRLEFFFPASLHNAESTDSLARGCTLNRVYLRQKLTRETRVHGRANTPQ